MEQHALGRDLGLYIVLMGILLSHGCSEKVSVGEGTESRNPSQQRVVRIVFQLPGDDIGGLEHRATLEAIKAGIVGAKAGEIVSSGYGMGNMELVVATGDNDSTARLERIVEEIYPKASYRLERRPR
jgi:hypothetical protein